MVLVIMKTGNAVLFFASFVFASNVPSFSRSDIINPKLDGKYEREYGLSARIKCVMYIQI